MSHIVTFKSPSPSREIQFPLKLHQEGISSIVGKSNGSSPLSINAPSGKFSALIVNVYDCSGSDPTTVTLYTYELVQSETVTVQVHSLLALITVSHIHSKRSCWLPFATLLSLFVHVILLVSALDGLKLILFVTVSPGAIVTFSLQEEIVA